MNKASDCLIFVAFTLLFLFPQIGLAYENTIVIPVDEDDDYEYGLYQTHDNATGKNRSGSYIYQKPEEEREEPDDIYFKEKWDEMLEDSGMGRKERRRERDRE